MTSDGKQVGQIEQILDTEDLAEALHSDKFKKFLDQIPIALAVSEFGDSEKLIYANPKLESLCGRQLDELIGQPWSVLAGREHAKESERQLSDAIVEDIDRLGSYVIERPGAEPAIVEAYSNVIEDEAGKPAFRLAALVSVELQSDSEVEELQQRVRDKDTLLRELQHRVKNNLQMITALIRIEARNMNNVDPSGFGRLAGRVESLALLYRSLSAEGHGQEVDLGIYLSQIASAVMAAHAVEGIRLDLKVDTYPVSVNVAMPTGLVVNELLTNTLKHAFVGRDGGTITLHSLADQKGCRVIVADDGNGLPEGVVWPRERQLGALIVQSLRENAKASIDIQSNPGKGMKVTIGFRRATVVPEQAS